MLSVWAFPPLSAVFSVSEEVSVLLSLSFFVSVSASVSEVFLDAVSFSVSEAFYEEIPLSVSVWDMVSVIMVVGSLLL